MEIVIALAGAALFVAPWALGFAAAGAAAWNGWIIGAAILLIALGGIMRFMKWEPWAHAALGLWAVIAPFALGFSGLAAALAVHVVAGLLTLALAGVELWRTGALGTGDDGGRRAA
ncbi:hypothetical protein C2I36_15740 [Rhodobacteraceae bacterium WD3A24]|nr:hypothetical protein C2I36_15740 [Rhodobacteraceae bacterium WD3A24]